MYRMAACGCVTCGHCSGHTTTCCYRYTGRTQRTAGDGDSGVRPGAVAGHAGDLRGPRTEPGHPAVLRNLASIKARAMSKPPNLFPPKPSGAPLRSKSPVWTARTWRPSPGRLVRRSIAMNGAGSWSASHGTGKATNNKLSSCWVRVSQGWAGGNWGAVAIPRIGQDVIQFQAEGHSQRTTTHKAGAQVRSVAA